MTKLERLRIVQTVNYGPRADPKTFKCNMLQDDGSCKVYDVRPYVCRIWGAVRAMQCPHGCRPDRFLTVNETIDLQRQVMEVGGPVVKDPAGEAAKERNPSVSLTVLEMEFYRGRGL
jgi:Fe-S-cluster containining protein